MIVVMLFSSLSQILARWFYTGVITLSIPVVLLRLWWRGRKNPAYRERWLERFGIFEPPPRTGGIWVHAVSVGESVVAAPLIRALRKQFPDEPITITSTTPTGFARVRELFKDEVFQVYFPYDLPGNFTRFLERVRPRMLILMETELWLNCLHACWQSRVRTVIVNARLSPKSMRGYRWIGAITRQMLRYVTKVIAQSEQDGARFIALGLEPDRLIVAGNMKFDVALKDGVQEQGRALRETWGDRPVWIAASTHAGEDEIVLAAFREIQKQFANVLLILVPRHLERFESVATTLQQQGYSVVRRSHGQSVRAETEIFLGDTMGELSLLYAASDVAFVGGSFIAVGGQNTLEAAALGIPVIVGPHVHNFVDITRFLRNAKALVQVVDVPGLAQAVVHWFSNPADRQRAGLAGKTVVEKNRGAIQKIMNVLVAMH